MSQARSSTRTTAAVVLAVGVAFVSGGAPGAAVAKKKPKAKPHLVLVKTKVLAPRYAFRGEDKEFLLRYVIKNVGAATAPKSRTVLLIRRPGYGGFVVVRTLTPHLSPGKSFHGHSTQAFRFDDTTPLGAYRLTVCPDFLEAVPGPRPRCVKKGRFYVAEKEWVGQISGVGSVNGAARGERWESLPAQLDFSRYLGHGAFEYDFSGDVTWTDHGVNNGGCLWQGSGSLTIDKNNAGPGIVLNYATGRYKGKETLHDRFYTQTASGGGGFPCHGTQQGPTEKTFLNIPKRALHFAHKSLKGKFGSSFAEDSSWKWSFH